MSKMRWRLHQILWPSQKISTLRPSCLQKAWQLQIGEDFVISKKESNNFVISKKEFNTKGD